MEKQTGRYAQPSARAAPVISSPDRAAESRLDSARRKIPSSIRPARRAGVPSSSQPKLPLVPATVGSEVIDTAGEP